MNNDNYINLLIEIDKTKSKLEKAIMDPNCTRESTKKIYDEYFELLAEKKDLESKL